MMVSNCVADCVVFKGFGDLEPSRPNAPLAVDYKAEHVLDKGCILWTNSWFGHEML